MDAITAMKILDERHARQRALIEATGHAAPFTREEYLAVFPVTEPNKPARPAELVAAEDAAAVSEEQYWRARGVWEGATREAAERERGHDGDGYRTDRAGNRVLVALGLRQAPRFPTENEALGALREAEAALVEARQNVRRVLRTLPSGWDRPLPTDAVAAPAPSAQPGRRATVRA